MRSNKLLTIVGPTASGKSALALKLAREYDGEIVCADSRTVYKGLDIGTAKPTQSDREGVPHHLIDVVMPDQHFTVVDFKALAEAAIDDIQSRGRIPILVGGSGLYIDAVLFGYDFSSVAAGRDPHNPRHLAANTKRTQQGLRSDAFIVGLRVPKEVLRARIASRVDSMVDAGLVEEVRCLQASYPDSKAIASTGYKAFIGYIEGRINLEQAKDLFIGNDLKLAKRQMTWFRRNKFIQWFTDTDAAAVAVANYLAIP